MLKTENCYYYFTIFFLIFCLHRAFHILFLFGQTRKHKYWFHWQILVKAREFVFIKAERKENRFLSDFALYLFKVHTQFLTYKHQTFRQLSSSKTSLKAICFSSLNIFPDSFLLQLARTFSRIPPNRDTYFKYFAPEVPSTHRDWKHSSAPFSTWNHPSVTLTAWAMNWYLTHTAELLVF